MKIYIPLSVVFFLEYAVWGAWAPVLATRLLGPLKLTGKQTGWIYATLPLACIFSPILAGQVADKWLNVEWILAAAHLIGAVLLFLAIRAKTFSRLFLVMLLYSTCYAATMPLVTAAVLFHVKDVGTQSLVFIWAPVAWALVGWFLSGWRMVRKSEGDGSDCLKLASLLSVIAGVTCLLLPPTPPAQSGGAPIVLALEKLSQPDFLIFVLTSMFVAGMMQFYFLGSGQFMMNIGISGKAVPGSMAIAQAAQAIATYFVLSHFVDKLGFHWTLTIGAACWLLMYIAYVAGKPRSLIIAAQPLHGVAYVLFIIGGWMYAGNIGADAPSSMQALISAATIGIGLFFGTQLAGMTMDRFSVEGKFQWQKIWAVPLVIVLAGTIVLGIAFKGDVPGAKKSPQPAQKIEMPANG
jgi:MFS family permease